MPPPLSSSVPSPFPLSQNSNLLHPQKRIGEGEIIREKNVQNGKRKAPASSNVCDLPKKRRRQEIIYPPDIAYLSEFAKEEWRLKMIYEEESSKR